MSRTLVSSTVLSTLPRLLLLSPPSPECFWCVAESVLNVFQCQKHISVHWSMYSALRVFNCLTVPFWNHYQILLLSLDSLAPHSLLKFHPKTETGHDLVVRAKGVAGALLASLFLTWGLIHHVVLGELLSLHRPHEPES